MKKVIGIGVLLQTLDNTYLLQERDGNAKLNPNRIAPFGGGIENGESVIQCAQREMLEELGLKIETSSLETVAIFPSHNQPGVYIHMFLTRNVDLSSLELKEGKSIVELSREEIFRNNNVTDFTKDVLNLL